MARSKLLQTIQYYITPPNFNQHLMDEMLWGEDNTCVSGCSNYNVEQQLKENELALCVSKRVPGFKTKQEWLEYRIRYMTTNDLIDHILIINYNEPDKIKYMYYSEYKPMTLEKYLTSLRINYKARSWRERMERKLFEILL